MLHILLNSEITQKLFLALINFICNSITTDVMRKISFLMFFSILIIMTEAQVVSISFQERIKNSDAIIEGEVIDRKC